MCKIARIEMRRVQLRVVVLMLDGSKVSWRSWRPDPCKPSEGGLGATISRADTWR
jgi:hypothetical protein